MPACMQASDAASLYPRVPPPCIRHALALSLSPPGPTGILVELPLAPFFLKKFRGAYCDINDLPTLDPELHRCTGLGTTRAGCVLLSCYSSTSPDREVVAPSARVTRVPWACTPTHLPPPQQPGVPEALRGRRG